jgi:uncharacterized membrane protein YccC
LSGSVVFLGLSRGQIALVVILANHPQMLFPEALVAVAAMAVAILIVIISPMFATMIVVMVFSPDGLGREDHPSGNCEEY